MFYIKQDYLIQKQQDSLKVFYAIDNINFTKSISTSDGLSWLIMIQIVPYSKKEKGTKVEILEEDCWRQIRALGQNIVLSCWQKARAFSIDAIENGHWRGYSNGPRTKATFLVTLMLCWVAC